MASSSRRSHAGIFSTLLRFLTALLVAFLTVPFVGWAAAPANAGVPGVCDTNNLLGDVTNFQQNTMEDRSGDWINGALNQQNSVYAEGDFVPQWAILTDIPAGENELIFTYDTTKNGLHAYDFVDHLAILDEPGATITWDAPAPTPPVPLPTYDNADGTATVVVHVTFQVPAGTDGNMTITWDGHIAAELDYGPNSGAGTINGAPYHFSLETLNCASAGQQDNQLMADAVQAGHITVIKDAQPNTATPFHFSITPGGAASDFDLVDNGDPTTATITYRVPPGIFNIAEVNLPAEWGLTQINCVDAGGNSTLTDVPGHTATATVVDDGTTTCTFVNEAFVPHWVLTKTSDKPVNVMPGDSITYTLHVHNDSQATIQSATVSDDLSAVLDDATITSLGAGLVLNGTTLTWTVPTPLAPGADAEVSYTVKVNDGAWNVSIDNLATPGPGGDCPTPADCTTHHETPPVTTFVVKKVDFETGAALAGAHFQLWIDKGEIGVKDAPDVPVDDEKITGADGLASWDELLAGPYLLQETQAPPGYALPAVTIFPVVIETGEGARDWTLDPFVVDDPSIGNLAILSKQQYTKNQNGDWVKRPDHGYQTEFGQRVKYVVKVEATGTKLFHNVQVKDWVPGFNPQDTHQFGTGSTMKATLVPGSAKCSGLPCDVTVSPGNLVTWNFGTVKHHSATVEMIVVFPQAPANPNYDADGFFFASLWNVATLSYDTAVTSGGMTHTVLRSNEVEIEALLIQPPPGVVPCTKNCLPNTGSSPYLLQLGGLGGLTLLAGTALLISGRRREEPTA
jgi:uncharacterized repeat protein (TIGR01451 family)/LPXTG-motif cell wall-anchored protein